MWLFISLTISPCHLQTHPTTHLAPTHTHTSQLGLWRAKHCITCLSVFQWEMLSTLLFQLGVYVNLLSLSVVDGEDLCALKCMCWNWLTNAPPFPSNRHPCVLSTRHLTPNCPSGYAQRPNSWIILLSFVCFVSRDKYKKKVRKYTQWTEMNNLTVLGNALICAVVIWEWDKKTYTNLMFGAGCQDVLSRA